ncbi:STAS domain-containing protein [Flavobacterium sp. WC2421]|jgi:anti-anti-sigma regulatory factor|uniref:STAS domain-containing protein n=2 Tax=unclassified Flavobacterium TaxID=196869 RepID=A0AB39WAH1_9FLAO
MAIQITYNAGVYEINGTLVSQNGNALKSHIETLLNFSKGIVISLNKVLEIDSEAVKSIESLYNKAWGNDKMFYIVGMENKKVSDLFTSLNLNDILL